MVSELVAAHSPNGSESLADRANPPSPGWDWEAMTQDEKARIEHKLDEILEMLRSRNGSASTASAAPTPAAIVSHQGTTAVAPTPAFGGTTTAPDSTATSGAPRVVPDASLVVAIDATSLAAPMPTRRSTEGPSRSATESTPAFAPARTLMSPTATVDVVPNLAATVASDGALDGDAISDAASLPVTCSPGCPRSDASALVSTLIPSATTQSMAQEAVPPTAPTPLEVTATELLKPFIVIDLSVLAPSKCLPKCLVNGVVDNIKLNDVVSHERIEVVALAMVSIIYVDPGDHRQPPWPPPLICTIRLLCWGISTRSQIELKTQYKCTGVMHPWPPLCEHWSPHELQEIFGQLASFHSQHCSSTGLRGTFSAAPESRMLQLHGNLLTPLGFLIAKDQFNASMKWCCEDLLWRVKEWALHIQWMPQADVISYAPPWHEQCTTRIPLQVIVDGSVLALFSGCAPCSFNFQNTGYWFANDPGALEKMRLAARYSTKRTMEILQISAHWSSMRKEFQIIGELIHWSRWRLNTWSPIVLMVYTYWLPQEHVYMGLDLQLLGWFEIEVFCTCNTDPEFTIFEKLSFPVADFNNSGAFHCGGENHATEQIFKKNLGGVTFLPSCLQEKYLAIYICSIRALAPMKNILLEGWFTCVLRVCTEISIERSKGTDELFPCLASYLLVECFPIDMYGSDKSSISGNYQISKAGLPVAMIVILCLPIILIYKANPHGTSLWDPRACILALCSCEKWQAPSYEGRNVMNQAVVSDSVHVGHNYYTAFVNKIAIGYNYCSDHVYSFNTICSDLIYYSENYHRDAGNIKEVHAPWDPGKSALCYPRKTPAWGQAGFQEGRNVMTLAYWAIVKGWQGWAWSEPTSLEIASLLIHIHKRRRDHPVGSR